MKKYPFNRQGIDALQTKLYNGEISHLQEQALSIAEDPLSWVAQNFELDVTLLESLRDLPEDLHRVMGWSIAAAALTRTPVKVQGADRAKGFPFPVAIRQLDLDLSASLLGQGKNAGGNTPKLIITLGHNK